MKVSISNQCKSVEVKMFGNMVIIKCDNSNVIEMNVNEAIWIAYEIIRLITQNFKVDNKGDK